MEEKLVLYTLPNCPQCKLIHNLLQKKNIDFEESQDTAEMIKLGIDHTPAVILNNKIVCGKELFDYINRG